MAADPTAAPDAPSGPLPEILDEAARVAAAAAEQGVELKVLGGVGIALRCPSAREAPLRRRYADLDLAGRASARKAIVALLVGLGYLADEQFNALHGATRLFFWDAANARQVDVFLDRFEMCHKLDLAPRLAVPGPTMPLADMLLMKLQVVETNEKDLIDILAILVDHDFAEDDSAINLAHIRRLTAGDWGLWRTVLLVAERADAFSRRLEGFSHAAEVHARIQALVGALEESEKSRGWKLRARIGERKRWYELPEESH
jgi:hypothetical protein